MRGRREGGGGHCGSCEGVEEGGCCVWSEARSEARGHGYGGVESVVEVFVAYPTEDWLFGLFLGVLHMAGVTGHVYD